MTISTGIIFREKPFDHKKTIALVEERKDEEPFHAVNQEHYRLAQISFNKRYELPDYILGITLMTENKKAQIVVFEGIKEIGNAFADETNIEDILYTPSNELYSYPVSEDGFKKALASYKKVLEVGKTNYKEIYWLDQPSEKDAEI